MKGLARTNLARLNANGSGDGSFNAVPPAHPVRSLALQPDGKVLVGGDVFDNFGLTRLNPNGSPDTSFNANAYQAIVSSEPYFPYEVMAIAIQADGKIVFGAESMLRLHPDGTRDLSFNAAAAGNVRSIALQADGKVIIAGTLYQDYVSGTPSPSGVVRLNTDGSLDTGFSSLVSPGVRGVALQADGKVLVGWAVNGTDKQALGRFHADGSVDPTFSPALAGLGLEPIPIQFGGSHGTTISAIQVLEDGKILVSGYGATEIVAEESYGLTVNFFLEKLNADGSHAAGFNTMVGLASGNYFSGWYSAPSAAITLQPDGKILVGGTFSKIGGINRSGIARLHADGTVDATFVPGTVGIDSARVSALSLQPDGKVLAGGSYFGMVNGVGRRGIVRFNANGSLDSSFAPGAGTNASASSVNALALQPDGKVIIGGDFTTFNGTNRNRLARLNADGSLDGGFNPGADGTVGSLALRPDGGVLIGGDFLTVNGVISPHLALLRGDPPASFAAWMGRYDFSGGNEAEDADPDRDGLANSVEFVLGGHPGLAAPVERPRAAIDNDKLVFSFSRDDISETPGLTLTVEAGTDLLNWTVYTIGPDTARSSPGVSVVENADGADTITVLIPRGTNPARFARMKVVVAP